MGFVCACAQKCISSFVFKMLTYNFNDLFALPLNTKKVCVGSLCWAIVFTVYTGWAFFIWACRKKFCSSIWANQSVSIACRQRINTIPMNNLYLNAFELWSFTRHSNRVLSSVVIFYDVFSVFCTFCTVFYFFSQFNSKFNSVIWMSLKRSLHLKMQFFHLKCSVFVLFIEPYGRHAFSIHWAFHRVFHSAFIERLLSVCQAFV